MTWLLWLGRVLCLLVVAAVGLSAYGSTRWTDITRTLTSRLETARIDEKAQSPSPARYDSHELEGLPGPVQRYFRAALKEGQPIIAVVTVELAGTFNMGFVAIVE